jgi:hypothetical protein
MADKERRSLPGTRIEIETDERAAYTGAESFLVGISPQYWAHVPLSIVDVQNLKLVNGINCYWSTVAATPRTTATSSLFPYPSA